MKCKYCGFEAEIITRSADINVKEFISSKKVDEHTIEPILICPKCGKEQ